MRTIILTSCVYPAVPVHLRSPRQRLAELLAAIELWRGCAAVGRIIVAEASRFRPPRSIEGVEWFQRDLAAVAARHGKGRSEAALLAWCADHFRPAAFWKVTGRLFVENFAGLEVQEGAAVACAAEGNGMDTRCFYVQRAAFDELLRPAAGKIDDRSNRTFIERVYWEATEGRRTMFAARLRYVGQSGTNGRAYDVRCPVEVMARAREQAAEWIPEAARQPSRRGLRLSEDLTWVA
jgi:hypothetical protein